MCFLLNLTSDLDDDFAEMNMNDLVETTVSAFAQLLLSKNKMKVRLALAEYHCLLLNIVFLHFYSLSFPYLEVLSNQGFSPFDSFLISENTVAHLYRAFASGKEIDLISMRIISF